jgi:hypothetical protein
MGHSMHLPYGSKYLGGRWFAVDARKDASGIGRVLIAPAATPPACLSTIRLVPETSQELSSVPTKFRNVLRHSKHLMKRTQDTLYYLSLTSPVGTNDVH